MRKCIVALGMLLVLVAPMGVSAAQAPDTDQLRIMPVGPDTGERFLEPLARGLVRALGSDAFRQSLFEELNTSRYVEGRVALKRLLVRETDFRRELLWHSEISVPWNRVADVLPELELYFPIKEHRASWAGALPVQVAVPVEGVDRYRAYSTDGTTVTIDATATPTTPTLMLAPSEIDFDDLESALEGGKRTGSYLLRQTRKELAREDAAPAAPLFDENQVFAKASGVDPSRHTYLYKIIVPNNHDPLRGSMEIEFFGSVDGSYSGCARITGIEAGTEYWAIRVDNHKMAYAVPTGINTVDIKVYEDDDDGCVIRSGDDYLGVANLAITDYNFIYSTSTREAYLAVQTYPTVCGDTYCEADESRSNCCVDCASCGDGVCSSCESGSTCSADCYVCGNGYCERSKGENEYNCSADCDSCGNGYCEPGEDYFSCPFDCCEEGARICPE